MKLILNADDFGLTESVNLAIVDYIKAGVVKSTTVMMNQPGTAHAAALNAQGLIPDVGLHFTLTSGRPIAEPSLIPSLVDASGCFYDRATLFNKSDICPKEVVIELKAQYQAALDAGFEINHIDSHHFAGAFRALKVGFTEGINEIGLPARRIDNVVLGQEMLRSATPDAFDMGFYAEGATLEHLKAMLTAYKHKMPTGVVELMCHPATEVTEELCAVSGYTQQRVDEWEILTSRTLKEWLETNQIRCIGFNDIASND